MEGDIHGVRIVPSVLVFDNTVPGSVYTLNVTVKNVAGSSRSIRYYGPKTKVCWNLELCSIFFLMLYLENFILDFT